MQPVAWSAVMIGPSVDGHGAARLRTEFRLDEQVTATLPPPGLHVSAHGIVEVLSRRRPVSHDVLTPGFSSYEWRLRYRTYDVTEALPVPRTRRRRRPGPRARARLVSRPPGAGRASGPSTATEPVRSPSSRSRTPTVTRQVRRAPTRSWTAGPSAVLADDLYDGQTIDARLSSDAWLRPGFDRPGLDARGGGRRRRPVGADALRRSAGDSAGGDPPGAVWTSPSGKTLVDFGQNLVGWLKITTHGRGRVDDHRPARRGDRARRARHPPAALGARRPTRSSAAVGDDVFEPTMTFHGFRYVEVTRTGRSRSRADNLVAVVVSSDLARIGTFACSDDLVNQLHRNVVWSQRGNFLDLPTDCPQRDERQGWTGDIAVFAPTAAYLFDVDAFLRDWLLDLAAEQRARRTASCRWSCRTCLKRLDNADRLAVGHARPRSGATRPSGCPGRCGRRTATGPCSSSAIPRWPLHVRTCVACVSANGLWDTGFQLGDWLDPTAPPENPFQAKADKYVIATACLYRSAALTAASARVLGPDRGRGRVHGSGRAHPGRLQRSTTSVADGTIRQRLRRPCTPWPSPSTCWIPTPSSAGRRPTRRAGRPRTATRSPPASPAPRTSPTPSAAPVTSRRPTGCCCRPRTRPGSTR